MRTLSVLRYVIPLALVAASFLWPELLAAAPLLAFPLETGILGNSLKALRETRADVIADMEALLTLADTEKRELSEDETKQYAELEAKEKAIAVSIKRREALDEIKKASALPVLSPRIEPAAKQHFYRAGLLKNFKGADAEERAHRFGQWCFAAIYGSTKATEWCRQNGLELKAASEGVNTAGGFLVPQEFEQTIIDLRDSYGTFRQNVQVWPMGRDTMSIPKRVSGLTAYYVGEGVAPTASQMVWTQVMLTARKLAALTLFSTELDEDAAVSYGDILAGEIAYAFAVAEDAAGWLGDGSPTYGNITGVCTRMLDGNHDNAFYLAASNHDTFAEIDAADITGLMSKVPLFAKRTAKWYMSEQAWEGTFSRLIQAVGGLTSDAVTGSPFRRNYLGYPVVTDQTLPQNTGDISGTIMFAFGDLSMAVAMGSRRGLTLQRSTEYKFAEDQIAIKGTERYDINPCNLGNSTAAGTAGSIPSPLVGMKAN